VADGLPGEVAYEDRWRAGLGDVPADKVETPVVETPVVEVTYPTPAKAREAVDDLSDIGIRAVVVPAEVTGLTEEALRDALESARESLRISRRLVIGAVVHQADAKQLEKAMEVAGDFVVDEVLRQLGVSPA